MRQNLRFLLSVGVALAVGFVAVGCGDKGGGGGSYDPKSPVGTWSLDTQPIADAMKPMVEGMKKMVEAMPAGPEKEKQLKDVEEKMGALAKMKMELTLNKDGTASFDADMPGEKHETGTGTWTQDGEKVTIVQKMKNGKPAEGKNAEPKTLTFKDNKLTATEGGVTMGFKRK